MFTAGSMMGSDQAGGEQFAGQQVSHGEGDTKVQDGEADGLFSWWCLLWR